MPLPGSCLPLITSKTRGWAWAQLTCGADNDLNGVLRGLKLLLIWAVVSFPFSLFYFTLISHPLCTDFSTHLCPVSALILLLLFLLLNKCNSQCNPVSLTLFQNQLANLFPSPLLSQCDTPATLPLPSSTHWPLQLLIILFCSPGLSILPLQSMLQLQARQRSYILGHTLLSECSALFSASPMLPHTSFRVQLPHLLASPLHTYTHTHTHTHTGQPQT